MTFVVNIVSGSRPVRLFNYGKRWESVLFLTDKELLQEAFDKRILILHPCYQTLLTSWIELRDELLQTIGAGHLDAR